MGVDVGPLRNAVRVRATANCPMCGNDGWAGGADLAGIPFLERTAATIDVLPFVCTSCGFVRLHAVQALETIDD